MYTALLNTVSNARNRVEEMRILINNGYPDIDFSIKSDEIKKQREDYENRYISCKQLLHKTLIDLIIEARPKFTRETEYLQCYMEAFIGSIGLNPYDFGAIQVLVNLLNDKINEFITSIHGTDSQVPKIFISHSHADAERVRSFVNNILILGCGLNNKNIFCSSIESAGIKTGEDLRNRLKSEIKGCKIVFLMLSNSYSNSSMCLNEMGASWVLSKNTMPLLFPERDYKEMEWLYQISKGMRLDNEQALDELRDFIIESFNITISPTTSQWTSCKKDFIAGLNHSI
ncbi:MAG: toll/interleukin-1 receptor domain-containing protein [Muribaculum sp.]|nr:toll/interleukin-1 receptor domain-containing protein [Muribaculum sp.]